uniref:Reverse transcriptase domain-containing protein n=1 Tax=Tanacetum cinerariifolium TaxID=118510 RepID=A0A699GJL4_TANCI|nr:hypothetical protein [Tanacetum cinerariifolium]
MSSSSKSPCDYLRKYQRAILEPWRQSHGLPPSPPSPPPTRTAPTSPTLNNSISYSSPLQKSSQNLNEIHYLSNLIDINLQQAIEATNPSPPTSPYIPPPSLDQVKSSHWQYKFPLPVKVVATARRLEMPLPEVCTAIEEKKKKLPVKDIWQLH